MRALSVLIPVLLLACGSGGPAPTPVEGMEEVCAEDFCMEYPEGWRVEAADGTLVFRHPAHDRLVASASVVNMQFLVESNQGSWPADIESVERDFWAIQQAGTESTRLEELVVEPDGSVRSRGVVEGLVQWHRLSPIGAGPAAVGVTVRAPNVGWEAHARVFLDGVAPAG